MNRILNAESFQGCFNFVNSVKKTAQHTDSTDAYLCVVIPSSFDIRISSLSEHPIRDSAPSVVLPPIRVYSWLKKGCFGEGAAATDAKRRPGFHEPAPKAFAGAPQSVSISV